MVLKYDAIWYISWTKVRNFSLLKCLKHDFGTIACYYENWKKEVELGVPDKTNSI